jgi:hypothetical protein
VTSTCTSLPIASSLASGKTVTAAIEASDPTLSAQKIVDGDRCTDNARWQSPYNPATQENVTVDLGQLCSVTSVDVLWDYDTAARDYTLQTSQDGTTWSVKDTVTGYIPPTSGATIFAVLPAGRSVALKSSTLSNTKARFIRLSLTKRSVSAVSWGIGYSIQELGVNGGSCVSSSSPALPSPTPVTIPTVTTPGGKTVTVVTPVLDPTALKTVTNPVKIEGDISFTKDPSNDKKAAKVTYQATDKKGNTTTIPSASKDPYQTDSTLLPNGEYTIKQSVTYADGTTQDRYSKVLVSNKQIPVISPVVRYVRLHKLQTAIGTSGLGVASVGGAAMYIIARNKRMRLFGKIIQG